MNHGVQLILVAHLGREMTEQVDRPCKEVITNTAETFRRELITVTADKIQMTMIRSTQLIHVVRPECIPVFCVVGAGCESRPTFTYTQPTNQ